MAAPSIPPAPIMPPVLSKKAVPIKTSLLLMMLTTAIFFLTSKRLQDILTIADSKLLIDPITMTEFAARHIPTIATGLYIQEFSQFDMLTGTLAFNGSVWFRFDPELIGLDLVSKFSFESANITYKSPPITQLAEDGSLFARFDVQVAFKNNMNYRFFPFDDHRINLVIVNKYISIHDAFLITQDDDETIICDMESQGWRLQAMRTVFGYRQENFDSEDRTKSNLYPAAGYEFDYEHNDSRSSLVLFLPMLILFFLACVPFSISADSDYSGARLGLTSASLTGLVSFRFAIDNFSPHVGYFMISDYLFLLFIVLCFICFITSVFDEVLHRISSLTILVGTHLLVIGTLLVLVVIEQLWVN